MHVLVTGGAGFIGSHIVEALVARGDRVTVLDNLDPYYDPAIKRRNLAAYPPSVRVILGDLREPEPLARALDGVEAVIHMAARAGVRRSIDEPALYVDNNVRGIQLLIDSMLERGVDRLVYASSSSVYGARPDGPFRETDPVATPESPYAATKMAGELLIHAASRTRGLRATCLRLFTVYGPRQRPEMAIHLFSRLALAGQPITRFGDGRSKRDYTYVTDVAAAFLAAMDRPVPYAVYNIGNDSPIFLNDLLDLIGETFGVTLDVRAVGDQAGDMPATWADIDAARRDLDYAPRVPLGEGLARFRRWLTGG